MLSNAKLLESACCKWQMYGGVVVTEPGRAGAGERVLMRVRSSAESVWGCFRSRRKEKLGQSLDYRLIISAPSRLLHLPSSSTEKSGSCIGDCGVDESHYGDLIPTRLHLLYLATSSAGWMAITAPDMPLP